MDCEYDGGAAPRWTKTLGSAATTTSGGEDEATDQPPSTRQGSDDDAAKIEAQLKNDGATNLIPASDMPPPLKSVPVEVSRKESIVSPNISLEGQPDAHAWYVDVYRLLFDTGGLTLCRLLSPDLPPKRHLRRIVEQYFANVHPLRCFAFVHKPSFMRQLDKGFISDDENALLHIICAHGVKYDIQISDTLLEANFETDFIS